MINWFKSAKKQKACQAVRINLIARNKDILENNIVRQKIYQIQILVGVTKLDFRSLYIETIKRYIAQQTALDKTTDWSVFAEVIHSLDKVILALKRRRVYLLPSGAESEASFRECEEWTFAVFSAALIRSIPMKIRDEQSKMILPDIAFSWLSRNSNLFSEWKRYLQDEIRNNIFTDIIEGLSAVKLELMIPPDDTDDIELTDVIEPVADITYDDFKARDLSRFDNKLLTLSGDSFWSWLQEALLKQELSCNQVDSVVHGVELGALICLPQTLDCFISFYLGRLKNKNLDSTEITIDQRMQLEKAIKKNKKQEGLIRNAAGSRLHTYCVGAWQDRRLLSGLVIDTEILFGINLNVPINPLLLVDPITGSC